MTHRAVLLDEIHPEASQAFLRAGWEVETFPKSINPADLAALSQDAQVLGVRSTPAVPAEVFANNDNLLAIGCFAAGFNHIDTAAAAERGITVFNSPRENTRAVAQYVVGSTLALLRRLPEHNALMHAGVWSKTHEHSHELQAKVMGVVGYGMIGSRVATMLDALGMDVLYYDLQPKHSDHGRVEEAASLDDLLSRADVVTIHVNGDKPVLTADAIQRMKPGSYIINASRAQTVDVEALGAALESGHIAGAAIDVYPKDPAKRGDPFEHPLRGRTNVLLTPHIGGSTEEAQTETGKKTAERLLTFFATGHSIDAVNIPEVAMARPSADTIRLTYLHRDQPGALEALIGTVADAGLNVEATSALQRRNGLGYIALDVNGAVEQPLLDEVLAQGNTVRLRTIGS